MLSRLISSSSLFSNSHAYHFSNWILVEMNRKVEKTCQVCSGGYRAGQEAVSPPLHKQLTMPLLWSLKSNIHTSEITRQKLFLWIQDSQFVCGSYVHNALSAQEFQTAENTQTQNLVSENRRKQIFTIRKIILSNGTSCFMRGEFPIIQFPTGKQMTICQGYY